MTYIIFMVFLSLHHQIPRLQVTSNQPLTTFFRIVSVNYSVFIVRTIKSYFIRGTASIVK